MADQKSIGEQRVRTAFNPSNNSVVDQIKQKSAELINLANSINEGPQFADGESNSERRRLVALAQTSYEQAAMWAVKAATI